MKELVIKDINALFINGEDYDVEEVANACLRLPKDQHKDIINSAAFYGQFALLEYLIQLGLDVNAKDSFGWTPLMSAASQGEYFCVQLLLAKGAKINEHNSVNTALTLAAKYDFPDVVRLLREHGAEEYDFARIGKHSKYWSRYDSRLFVEHTVKV